MLSVGAPNKKLGSRLTSVDDLPTDVVQHILNCLPLRDATRTSVLSKHWRHKWKSLSYLIFDRDLCDSISVEKDKYIKLVNNVLFCQIGPIHKLYIFIPSSYQHLYQARVKRWIQFVVDKGIKDLTLEHNGSRWPTTSFSFEAPVCLFSCLELTHLSVSYMKINPPVSFMGFPHLISLNLKVENFPLEKAMVERLISNCPKLRMLEMYILCDTYPPSDTYLCVSAPKLESLVIRSYVRNKIYVILGAATNISTVKLEVCYNPVSSYMIEFLRSLCNVGKLDLSFWCWEVMSGGGDTPSKLPLMLSQMKTLKLSVESPPCFWEHISLALCLIRSSPNLQQLDMVVNSDPRIKRRIDVLDFAEECQLVHLRSVKLSCVSNSSSDLKLVKFLLACSPGLEVIVIELNKKLKDRATTKVTNVMSKFARASPKAKMIFQT